MPGRRAHPKGRISRRTLPTVEREPVEVPIVACVVEHQAQLARLLNGAREGYLPTTVSIYGPPWTGKRYTTPDLREFTASHEDISSVAGTLTAYHAIGS